MNAEAVEYAEAARYRAVGHLPQDHMHRFGHQADEVPEGVVCARRLRITAVGLHLHAVDEIWELHRVLDEEDRDIVADEIPITGFGVELDRKAAHVTRRVDRSGAAGDGREANEDRTTRPFLLEDRRLGQFGNRPGAFEHAVRARPARMDDAFGNVLMVEMEDFLAEGEILEQGRPDRKSTRLNSRH